MPVRTVSSSSTVDSIAVQQKQEMMMSSLLPNSSSSSRSKKKKRVLLSAQQTPYMNNASRVLPVTVDANSPATRKEHLIRVVIALCPAILMGCCCHHGNGEEIETTTEETSLISSSSSSAGISSSDEEYFIENDNNESSAAVQKAGKYLTVRPLLGGLSNELFVVKNEMNHLSVLVRIHPPDECYNSSSSSSSSSTTTDAVDANNHGGTTLIDRDVDNRTVAWLSASGDAPLYYGRFQNGRVEEYYDHYVPLSCHDMSEHAATIASLMARIHSKHVPGNIFQEQTAADMAVTVAAGGHIWTRIDHWFDMARTAAAATAAPSSSSSEKKNGHHGGKDIDDDDDDDDDRRRLNDLMEELQAEWKWLVSVLKNRKSSSSSRSSRDCGSPAERAAIEFCGQVVLTHMDCQPLNLLRPSFSSSDDDTESSSSSDEDSKSSSSSSSSSNDSERQQQQHDLKLIDYEYAGMNPRAVDIANTFCEFCDMNNLQADYDNEYPAVNVQNAFLRMYLDSLTAGEDSCEHEEEKDDDIVNRVREHLVDDNESQQSQVLLQHLRQEIGRYTLVSHLGWSIWSLVQHHRSVIDFDYVTYAEHRMVGYRHCKQRFW